MTIGEWVKQYRKSHGMSMQAFGDVCGLSRAYISILEKGINPTIGFLLPCFAHKLGERLYRHNKTLRNYGIKYFSPEMGPAKDYFTINSPCSKA